MLQFGHKGKQFTRSAADLINVLGFVQLHHIDEGVIKSLDTTVVDWVGLSVRNLFSSFHGERISEFVNHGFFLVDFNFKILISF